MVSIKIRQHTLEETEFTTATIEADGFTVTAHGFRHTAKVTAVFDVQGVDSMPKLQRQPERCIRPETLTIQYVSTDGGQWTESGASDTRIGGPNLLKDGTEGKHWDVLSYDLPTWAKRLFRADEHGTRGGGPAYEWINSEYPRPA
jgi:hypothetical protein